MILQELPCRSARVKLQGDQPAPDPDDERLRGSGPMAGTESSTTEPVVTDLTGLAVAAGYLNNHILEMILTFLLELRDNIPYTTNLEVILDAVL